MQQNIVEAGEEIYRKKEDKLKEKYKGKVIAIDVESGEICGSGGELSEAAKKAHSKFPERRFYFKKVGSAYASHVLRW